MSPDASLVSMATIPALGSCWRLGQSCALSQTNFGSYLATTHKDSSFTLLVGCFSLGTNT